MLSIARETPDQEEVSRLLQKADERSSSLYGTESRQGSDVMTLVRQHVRFFVARLDGVAVGYGGYVPSSSGFAELKRIFVETEARGRGIKRSILLALEAEAEREGIRIMQLETGIRSVEARGLYSRFGYRECDPFGSYEPDPLSIFMEKDLGSAEGSAARHVV